MNARRQGAGDVPAGEQVLWRGASDVDRVARRWLRSALQTTAMQGISIGIFLLAVGAMAGMGSFLPVVIGFFVIVYLPQIPIGLRHARRSARDRSYILTEQRALIRSRDWHRDLRLVNLPELRLALEGDGFGTITFEPPSGGGPERYARRLARWIPQLDDSTELFVSIPDAERVMGLMRRAQADALAAAPRPSSPQTSGSQPFGSQPFGTQPSGTQPSGTQPSGTQPSGSLDRGGDGRPVPRTPSTEGPVARQSFVRSAGIMPYWFGGAFLAMGLLMMAVGVANAPTGGWIMALVAAPFAAIGAVFVRARHLHQRRRHRLDATGVRVRGEVLDAAGTGTAVNEVEQWVVRYRFRAGGVERIQQSDLVPWAAAARFAPGDEVTVVYDPADPSVSELPDLVDG